MAVALVNLLLGKMLDAVLVGTTAYALARRFGRLPSRRRALVFLVPVFAALDCFYLPALWSLDVSFTVHNQAAAAALGLAPDQSAVDVSIPGLWSALVWGLQALLGTAAGDSLLGGNAATDPSRPPPGLG
ncbi:MAG: hypothetical protein SCH98_10465 [Deferrisomatales bacterium]|nr:hypothetical protein [Deferrisomatales bacterium]